MTRGALAPAFAAVFALLVAPAFAAADCSDRSVSAHAAYVSSRSEWKEFDIAGRRLVRESGTLPGAEFSLNLRCADWNVQARISHLDGSRRYDGQTSTGVPVLSRSVIRQTEGRLQGGVVVGNGWELGARLSRLVVRRDIASAGGAQGYPERFDWTMALAGVQWRTVVGPGDLTLGAWAGTKLDSNMRLTLPGRDPATLPLGNTRQFELLASWRTPLYTHWYLEGELGYRRTRIGQGADLVITRNGFPVGVAHQPRSSMTDTPLALRLSYVF